MKRDCPIPGCKRRIRPERLVCRKHWYKIPADHRAKIELAFKEKKSDEEKREIIKAAFEAMAQLEAAKKHIQLVNAGKRKHGEQP